MLRHTLEMKSAGKTRRFARLAAWLLFAWAALILVVLPVHRYDWMQQIDASIIAPPDTDTANGTMFVLLLLAAVVASQASMMATANTGRERAQAISLILATILLWASRCLH